MSGSSASLVNAMFRPRRGFSFIVPQVVMQEAHDDRLAITQHPVEQGAPVSDHAFKLPATCVMRCGWSNAQPGLFGAAGALGFLSANSSYIMQVYQSLLELQATREPFDVWTGKRFYQNMLFENLEVETDHTTEYALMATARFQQVIIVSTSLAAVTPRSAQSNPAQTAPTENGGTGAATQAQPSLLQRGLSFFGIGGGAGGTDINTGREF